MELIAKDTPLLMSCLADMNVKISHIKEHVDKLQKHVLLPECCTKAGLDILELKNQQFLSYLINLSYLVLTKLQGSWPLSHQHPALDRLVEIRTVWATNVLEKMRPLEQRFSYQLDKLLRMASSGVHVGEHPLQFKPVPDNLVPKVSKETSVDHTSGAELYMAPRVRALPYKERNNGLSNVRKHLEHSKLVTELRDELTDFPQEVQTFGEFKRKRESIEDSIRTKYEEEYMTRLPKRRKSRDLGHASQEELNELIDFSAFKKLRKEGGKRVNKRRKARRRKI